eukprot:GHVN01091585.1.p2 GENE.GHVN01091585.1~~GHVN01091585.1.p2  ORF type:complete len:191 (+),score=17.63 GHVN01091585.1:491-1063(+)
MSPSNHPRDTNRLRTPLQIQTAIRITQRLTHSPISHPPRETMPRIQPLSHPPNSANLQRLEMVQKKTLRMIYTLRPFSYNEKLCLLNLQSMAERWDQYDLVLTYKIINSLIAIPSPWTLDHQIHHYTLRLSDPLRLHKPQPNSACQANSFFHRAVDKWNALPLEIREAPSIITFKQRLRKHQTASRSAVS